MKKSLLLLLLAMCSQLGIMARHLTVDEARQLANRQFAAMGVAVQSQQLSYGAAVPAPDKDQPVYVFNNGGRGFVLVAADDVLPNPVIAYGTSGSFDLNNCADATREWYEAQARLVQAIAAGEVEAPKPVGVDFSTVVGPLVQTRWNQGWPYNNLCPAINGERCVTGCVATALAQVVKYWEHPVDAGLRQYSYVWNGQTLSVDLTQSHYDWANMTNTYSNTATAAQQAAVAKLMYDCGVSLSMGYGLGSTGGSGAYTGDCVDVLVNGYGYDAGANYLKAVYFSRDEWAQIVKDELDADRPVIYSGRTQNNEGHCFVCDGYDTDGLFHINWGWGGMCDGYFELHILNPDQQGIGGAASGGSFTYSQSAIIGIQPDQGSVAAPTWMFCYDNASVTPADEGDQVFHIDVTELRNQGAGSFAGTLYVGFDDHETGDIAAAFDFYSFPADSPLGGDGWGFANLGFNLDASYLPEGLYDLKFLAEDLEGNLQRARASRDASPLPLIRISADGRYTLISAPAPSTGEARLWFDDIAGTAGSTVPLNVYVDNDTEVAAMQFSFALPAGMAIDVDGVTLNAERVADHEARVKYVAASEKWTVMVYSPTNAAFAGTEGAILTLPVVLGTEMGEFGVDASEDAVLSNAAGDNVLTACDPFTITVSDQTLIPLAEYEALRQLYLNTNGGSWTTQWQLTTAAGTPNRVADPAAYPGVTFSADGHVTELRLDGFGLEGEVVDWDSSTREYVSYLSPLTELALISVNDNLLEYDMSMLFSLCPKLAYLSADNNSLYQTIAYVVAPESLEGVHFSQKNQRIFYYWPVDMAAGIEAMPYAMPTVVLQADGSSNVRILDNYTWASRLQCSNEGDVTFEVESEDPCAWLADTQYMTVVVDGGVSDGSAFFITLATVTGDANMDCQMNVADMQRAIAYVFDDESTLPCNLSEADQRADRRINVQDVVTYVNMLHMAGAKGAAPAAARRVRGARQSDDVAATLRLDGTQLVLDVQQDVAALDLTLNVEGAEWTLPGFTVSTQGAHTVAYSLAGLTLTAGRHVIATVPEGTAVLGASAASPQGGSLNVGLHETATGIDAVKADEGAAYDLSGRRDSGRRGVKIQDGRKMLK